MNYLIHKLKSKLKSKLNQNDETLEQGADMYHCYLCEADFNVSDCDEHKEGDWVNGYYTFHYCPSCGDDGGEYFFKKSKTKNERILMNSEQKQNNA